MLQTQSKVQFWIFAGDKIEWGGGDTLKEAFVGGVLLFSSLIWINWRSLQQLALTKENWLWCLHPVSYLLKRTCDGEQALQGGSNCLESEPKTAATFTTALLFGERARHTVGCAWICLLFRLWIVIGLFQASSETDMKDTLTWCYCRYSKLPLTAQCLHI